MQIPTAFELSEYYCPMCVSRLKVWEDTSPLLVGKEKKNSSPVVEIHLTNKSIIIILLLIESLILLESFLLE